MSTAGEVEHAETETIHEDAEVSPGEAPGNQEMLSDAELSAKYGNVVAKGPPAASSFLQKRLQKGQKFFDSGDYNVARAKKQSVPGIPSAGGLANPATKRNLPLLLPPTAQDASGQPMPVLTPEDLPHHTHPHEPSKLCSSQVNHG